MRWRLTGRNWEGRDWWLAEALQSMLRQINHVWPDGHSALDGTVASKTHDAMSPTSDHRPTPHSGTGVVRAADVWVTGDQGAILTEQLRDGRDPRVRYVIWNRRIYSSYSNAGRRAWEWGPYTGLNGHVNHVHISTLPAGDRQAAAWYLPFTQPPEPPMPTNPTFDHVTADRMTEIGAQPGVDAIFEVSWAWAKQARIVREHSDPDDVVNVEQLMEFLWRYHHAFPTGPGAGVSESQARQIAVETATDLISTTRLVP